jgi:hypothetical protein
LCSETILVSLSYRADVPCRHRFAMGAVKSPIPGTMYLTTQTSTHTLVYSETIRERDAPEIEEK